MQIQERGVLLFGLRCRSVFGCMSSTVRRCPFSSIDRRCPFSSIDARRRVATVKSLYLSHILTHRIPYCAMTP